MTCETIGLIIVALIFPPLAVAVSRGCSGHLFLNIILTILGWFPGVIHALYIVFSSKSRHGYHHDKYGYSDSYGHHGGGHHGGGHHGGSHGTAYGRAPPVSHTAPLYY
eukprot:gene5884-6806_t